jgi:DNA-binding NarL/FixJ family response regulator
MPFDIWTLYPLGQRMESAVDSPQTCAMRAVQPRRARSLSPLKCSSQEPGATVERVLLSLAAAAAMTPTLTERLVEVANRLSYREIAALHGISMNTVKTEINAILGSLGASCCHEIRDASVAASARVDAGANEDEIRTFLKLRLE